MRASTNLRKMGAAVLLLLAGLLPVSCTDDASSPPTQPFYGAEAMVERDGLSRRTALQLSVENAAYEYVGRSSDSWVNESIVSDAGALDIVVYNSSRIDLNGVTLLIAVDKGYLFRPGWQVEVNGILLKPDDFTETHLSKYGFRHGPHGVFRPSGCGVFHPLRLEGTLAANSSWVIPLRASTGSNDGFRIHFDVGSSRLCNSTQNDITVIPPPDPISPIVACCYPDGSCAMVTWNDCVEFDGVPHEDGATCDPNPCGE